MKGWYVRALAVMIILSSIGGYLGPLAEPAWAASDHGTYVVQKGDTLNSIARRFGTDARTLQQLNRLSNPNQIWVGQRLIVPDAPGTALPAASQPPANAAVAPSAPASPAAGGCTYKAQPNDGLYSVARRFGVNVRDLARANGLSANSLLRAGQTLRIPTSQCGGGAPEVAPEPVPAARTPVSTQPASPTTPTQAGPQQGGDDTPQPSPSEPVTPRKSRVVILEPTPTPTPAIRPITYE
jgi:LysM repeat protein